MNSLCQERMAAAMAAALAAKGSMAPENSVEMRRYLDKLKDLVPHCPKNRKVTKLELIQHVIDYISDLQDTLQSDTESESPPDSPVKRISFSDAYDMPPPHAFPGYAQQDTQHPMGPVGYTFGFGGSSHDSALSYGGPALTYGNDYSSAYSNDYSSASAYSSGASVGAGYGAGYNSFSPVLYSDQGTTSTPRFASS